MKIFDLPQNIQTNLLEKEIALLFLYGSYAEGIARKESDVDIAVVMQKVRGKNIERLRADLASLLAPFFHSKELDIKFTKDVSPLLQHVIATRGKMLFQRSAADYALFATSALQNYEDTRQLRAIDNYYREQRIKKRIFGHPPPILLHLYE